MVPIKDLAVGRDIREGYLLCGVFQILHVSRDQHCAQFTKVAVGRILNVHNAPAMKMVS